ncbi:uncharacterized protein LOC110992393 isoform X1 [Pieris rapae]|uniref:uncharacterized protein LOC110992393 isoform X1 n=2 Tax=Pieris rapae TaxID=64459 RepID=UPI001E27E7BE|nr:uncharacterized protein LOC110992393 isoform X1 [Pieris rapae]
MRIKMFSCAIFFCILMLLIVDTRIGALPQTSIQPRKCHLSTNASWVGMCPDEKPYCTTVVSTPNLTISLACGAAQGSPCVLEYKTEYLLTCICDDNLCNAPYNQQLRDELLNFSTNFPANSDANLTEIFLKFTTYANVSNEAIYEMVTANTTSTSIAPVTSTSATAKNSTHVPKLPHAEALKQATIPPDDDEDEGEGSGVDESKLHEHASPAAPSSFLPAKENGAPGSSLNILYLVLLFLNPYF